MGNQAIKKPVTYKYIVEKKSKRIKFGSCVMQGWRNYLVNTITFKNIIYQEDAIVNELDIKDSVSLFGVFDGHGGI